MSWVSRQARFLTIDVSFVSQHSLLSSPLFCKSFSFVYRLGGFFSFWFVANRLYHYIALYWLFTAAPRFTPNSAKSVSAHARKVLSVLLYNEELWEG